MDNSSTIASLEKEKALLEEKSLIEAKMRSSVSNKPQQLAGAAGQILGTIGGYSIGAGAPNTVAALSGLSLGTSQYLNSLSKSQNFVRNNPIQAGVANTMQTTSPTPLINPVGNLITLSSMSPKERSDFNQYTKSAATEQAIGIPVGYGIGKVVSGVGGVYNSMNGEAFMRSVRTDFGKAVAKIGEKFGGTIDSLSSQYPEARANFTPIIKNITENWGIMTNEAKAALSKTPFLRDMISKDGTPISNIGTDLSLAEAQRVKSYLATKVPKNIKMSNLDILDTIHDVGKAMLDALPEDGLKGKAQLLAAKRDYGIAAEARNLLKNKIKTGNTFGTIMGDSLKNPDIVSAFKKLGLQGTLKRMSAYKSATNLGSAIPKIIGYGSVAKVGMDYLSRKMSKSLQDMGLGGGDSNSEGYSNS